MIGPNSGPAIGASEQPLLLACFNRGFKDTAGVGYAGAWGQDVLPPGVSVASVRQNLLLLVEGGQPSPQINSISAWGATLGGGAFVARSALGEDAFGDLPYAASMSTVPVDLANALISAGAVSAMELDINPEWVQMDTAATPGVPLVAQVPGQDRPADQGQ